MEQLCGLDDISYRPMMGEYIIYYRGKIVGGIYDDRWLVKKTKSALELMPVAICDFPYEGAKEMLLVDKIDNKEFLKKNYLRQCTKNYLYGKIYYVMSLQKKNAFGCILPECLCAG